MGIKHEDQQASENDSDHWAAIMSMIRPDNARSISEAAGSCKLASHREVAPEVLNFEIQALVALAASTLTKCPFPANVLRSISATHLSRT